MTGDGRRRSGADPSTSPAPRLRTCRKTSSSVPMALEIPPSRAAGTNVFKLFEAVDGNGHRADPRLTQQVAIYHDGVGTEVYKWVRIVSGATGWGLSRNIKQLYAELARVYEPGDRIYLFGFSRGAFTVRTLAGLITTCGILDLDRYRTNRSLHQRDPARRMRPTAASTRRGCRSRCSVRGRSSLRHCAKSSRSTSRASNSLIARSSSSSAYGTRLMRWGSHSGWPTSSTTCSGGSSSPTSI